MTMVSYARNHEDVVLQRALGAKEAGFYVDVGAGHPVDGSLTKHFYDRGWSGVNVEPASEAFQALNEDRPRDANLIERLADGGMTLTDVWRRHVRSDVDFLTVRAGHDTAAILAGADWQVCRARVVVVEAGAEPTEDGLIDAGYVMAAFDGVSRFYAPAGDADLRSVLAVPANVTDDFVPSAYAGQISRLRDDLGAATQQLAAARSLNASLTDDLKELAGLGERYRDLQQRLQDAHRTMVMARSGLADAQALYLQLLDEVVDVRAQCDDIRRQLEGVSPLGMGVARRVTKLGDRLPGAFGAAQKAADLRLAVKKARGSEPR